MITYYYPPDLSAGSFRAHALIQSLFRLYGENVHVDVMTTMPNRYGSHKSEKPEASETHGTVTIRRFDLPFSGSSQKSQALHFARFAAACTRHLHGMTYDLVFATSSRLMTAVLGASIARRMKTKLYLDIRDIFVETMADLKGGPLARLPLAALDLVERWAFNRADGINVVSGGFLPYFHERYPRRDLDVFTNGIDAIFSGRIQARAPRPGEELRIAYAGNLGDGQGLHKIVPDLAKALAGRAKLAIVGDGGRGNELRTLVEQVGAGNVTLSPPVPRDKIVELYNRSDVLFLHLNDVPAFRRVIPSKLFEYAATGKPILAGVSGFSADFIRAEIKGAEVFEPCNVAEARKAFDRLPLGFIERSTFVEKYDRQAIMDRMAHRMVAIATGS